MTRVCFGQKPALFWELEFYTSLVSQLDQFHLWFCAGCKQGQTHMDTRALAHMEGSSWVYHGDKKKSLLTDAIHLLYEYKTDHKVVVIDRIMSICRRNCCSACDATLPSPACKDRPFTMRLSPPGHAVWGQD